MKTLFLGIICFLSVTTATAIQSQASGDYTTATNWAGSNIPDASGETAEISHNITYTGDFSLPVNITVQNGGTLIITGNITLNGYNITLDAGGTIIIGGNFVSISSITNNFGHMDIHGSLTLNNDGFYYLKSTGTLDLYVFPIVKTGNGDLINEGGVLPIDLISFEAILEQNNVTILWSTASEKNNEVFIIEHSIDGNTFTQVGELAGAGNSNTLLYYNYTLDKAYEGINYYRLKQIDFDGNYEYSEIVSLEFKSSKAISPQLVINQDRSTFVNLAGYNRIDIYNINGNMIESIAVKGNSINYKSHITNGIYIITYSSDIDSKQQVFVKN